MNTDFKATHLSAKEIVSAFGERMHPAGVELQFLHSSPVDGALWFRDSESTRFCLKDCEVNKINRNE